MRKQIYKLNKYQQKIMDHVMNGGKTVLFHSPRGGLNSFYKHYLRTSFVALLTKKRVMKRINNEKM